MADVDHKLLAAVIGREHSLFQGAVEQADKELREAINGQRILVIGAAGSIGAAFVRQVATYGPAALHLMDINENGLVEVVRDLQSSGIGIPPDFQTLSIGLGGPESRAFVAAGFDYDTVVNFAALKHVRAERDPWSMLRMLNTNIVYLDDLLNGMRRYERPQRIFSVSSDKSVNPASAMGASKTLMEHVLWLHSDRFTAASARFANVAFSAGSLLEGFLQRLAKKQPLAAPSDVRRFFISHEEAGQLCLLGTFLGANHEVVFPGLSPQDDMLTFSEIAVTVLAHFGYEPLECASDSEARERADRLTADSKQWPVHFTASDTSGEKMYEEFYTAEDTVDLQRWSNIGVLQVPALAAAQAAALRTGLDQLRGYAASGEFNKAALIDVLKPLVPGLQHVETGSNLDHKM